MGPSRSSKALATHCFIADRSFPTIARRWRRAAPRRRSSFITCIAISTGRSSSMTARHRIVVSVENTPFFGWQAKLFYYSCVTRLGVQPLFIVHATGRPWEPEFYELVRAGATVKMAPSYVIDERLPRNSAGTLLHAAELCAEDDFIVLCDPDLLFVRNVTFPSLSFRKLLFLSPRSAAFGRDRGQESGPATRNTAPQGPTTMLRSSLRHPC